MQERHVLLLNWRDLRNPLAGGAEVHIWETFTRLLARGWRVSALCAAFDGAAEHEEVNGIHVTRCGGPHTYNLGVPSACRRLVKCDPPDVVVEFVNKLPLLSPLYVRPPMLAFVHHLFGKMAFREAGIAAGCAVKACEAAIPRVYRNTRFLTGSRSTQSDLAAKGIRPEMIEVIPYGVDAARYCAGAKAKRPTLLYIGRIKKYKGIDHLIRLVPSLLDKFPDLSVKIVGKGDALDGLVRLTRRLGMERVVEFEGFVSEAQKLEHYQKAWLTFFLSSKEGFGLTVPEAALCKTPTVGYDVPGLRDAIAHGETGALVPYGDTAALGQSLVTLLKAPHECLRLGENALVRYSDFSWDASADRVEDALLRAIERHQSDGLPQRRRGLLTSVEK